MPTRPRLLSSVAMALLLAACAPGDRPQTPMEPAGTHALAPSDSPDPSGKPGSGGTADPTATFFFPTGVDLDVRGDGLTAYLANGESRYRHLECGVNSKIFFNGSGDAIMHTDNPKFADQRCADYPRKLLVDQDGVGDGSGAEGSTVLVNVNKLATTTSTIALGAQELRGMAISGTRCERLVFNEKLGDGTPTGAHSVKVTRQSRSTWLVESQDATNNRAYCKADGRTYKVNVRFTIVSSTDLP